MDEEYLFRREKLGESDGGNPNESLSVYRYENGSFYLSVSYDTGLGSVHFRLSDEDRRLLAKALMDGLTPNPPEQESE